MIHFACSERFVKENYSEIFTWLIDKGLKVYLKFGKNVGRCALSCIALDMNFAVSAIKIKNEHNLGSNGSPSRYILKCKWNDICPGIFGGALVFILKFFYFEIISHLEGSCRISTENSLRLLHHHGTRLKTENWHWYSMIK